MSPTKRQISDSSTSSPSSADSKAMPHHGRLPLKTVRPTVSKSAVALPSSPPSSPQSEAAWSLPSKLPSWPPSSPPLPSPWPPHDGRARKQIELAHGHQIPDPLTLPESPEMPQLTPPSSETPSSRISQDGLEWEATLFGLKPRWTREPSLEVIESIAREHLSIPAADRCEIVFHAKGGFHKLFRVIPGGGVGSGYIMRVALPVDPHYKTSSEVATMEYIRSLTTIPIPKVVAHDSSNFNALGFEWILMEFMPGATLRERWKDLPMTTKECLVRQLARFQAQLFAEQHQEIGNVYRARCSTTQSPYYLGRIVTHGFFWGDHVHDTVPRGPFKDSHDWFSARLALKRLGLQRALESPDSDDDEREDASLGLSIVQKLLKLLPTVFPPDKPGPTFLFHDDLSLQNVLVDEHGVLTAVLDWECVSVLPLWCACKIPDLLRGGECDPPPPLDEVHHEPDGTVDSMYWDVLREFEKMKLRETFRDEMQRLCPEWVQVMDESGLQRDFDTAVTRLGEIWCKVINKWLETFENGNERWSLATSIETKFC